MSDWDTVSFWDTNAQNPCHELVNIAKKYKGSMREIVGYLLFSETEIKEHFGKKRSEHLNHDQVYDYLDTHSHYDRKDK